MRAGYYQLHNSKATGVCQLVQSTGLWSLSSFSIVNISLLAGMINSQRSTAAETLYSVVH